jgi:hypothetical protein
MARHGAAPPRTDPPAKAGFNARLKSVSFVKIEHAVNQHKMDIPLWWKKGMVSSA